MSPTDRMMGGLPSSPSSPFICKLTAACVNAALSAAAANDPVCATSADVFNILIVGIGLFMWVLRKNYECITRAEFNSAQASQRNIKSFVGTKRT
jgi:hypothetical protein